MNNREWRGQRLTWANAEDIRKALLEKNLAIDTPLKGCARENLGKLKASGWKVLLHAHSHSEYIIFKKKAVAK